MVSTFSWNLYHNVTLGLPLRCRPTLAHISESCLVGLIISRIDAFGLHIRSPLSMPKGLTLAPRAVHFLHRPKCYHIVLRLAPTSPLLLHNVLVLIVLALATPMTIGILHPLIALAPASHCVF